jgi:hypothetical protein
MSVVSYPQSFLHRPEDRSFLMELSAAGLSAAESCCILYRIWADFSTGGSDRRPVDAENLAADRQVRVLESFCEWKGVPGEMVRLAVMSGFLRVEPAPAGGSLLVCNGFYPINSNWNAKGNSFQRRGAYTRILGADLKKSLQSAQEREELWSRTGGGVFKDLPAETRREALVFINRVCRALKMTVPADSVLSTAGLFSLAVTCIQSHSVKSIDNTLMWLLSNRTGQAVPDRLDAILRDWPALTQKAAEEMGDG